HVDQVSQREMRSGIRGAGTRRTELIFIGQSGLVPMMAVGNVDGRGRHRLVEAPHPTRVGEGPDAVCNAIAINRLLIGVSPIDAGPQLGRGARGASVHSPDGTEVR